MSNYLKVLCGILIAAVIWSAIKPLSGGNWWLEMIPVFIALPLIIYLGTRYKISNLSYTLVLVYILMLVTQAHFGVGFVPIGKELAPFFDTERNIFDRITHLCSGLLWFYPLYEIVSQGVPGKRDFLDFMVPAMLIMGLGAVYEVAEFLAYKFVSEQLAFLFIGVPGDTFDASKDLLMALIGTIVAGITVFIAKEISERKKKKR